VRCSSRRESGSGPWKDSRKRSKFAVSRTSSRWSRLMVAVAPGAFITCSTTGWRAASSALACGIRESRRKARTVSSAAGTSLSMPSTTIAAISRDSRCGSSSACSWRTSGGGAKLLPSWSHGRSRLWRQWLSTHTRPVGSDPATGTNGICVARRCSRRRTASAPGSRKDGERPIRPYCGRNALA
jgi:hypothetical protein